MLSALLIATLTNHDAIALTASGNLYELTYSSATATLVGNVGATDVHALARDRFGVLWSCVPVSATTVRLITIDESSAATSAIGNVTSGGSVRAMSFDRDGSLLMLVRPAGLPDQLRRVNVSTLSSAPILDTGLTSIEGLVVAPEGPIYAWDTGPTDSDGMGLIKFLPASGQVVDVASTSGNEDILDLAVDEVGDLVGVGRTSHRISRADGTSGATSGDFGLEFEAIQPLVQMTSYDGALALSPGGALTRVNTTTGAALSYVNVGATGFVGFSRRNGPLEYFAARDVGASTELWQIDVGTGAHTVAATLPFADVRAMDVSRTGVFVLVEDGGAGNDDLLYSFNLTTLGISGPYPITGASEVEAMVQNPLNQYWLWDTQKGLLSAVLGGQNVELTAGATSAGPFDAADMNPWGRMFLSGNHVYSVHVPTETLSQLQSTTLGPVAGLAFLREYEPVVPQTYCTSQTNSLGCVPLVAFGGVDIPSATSGSGFELRALSVLGQKQGLFFYGVNGRSNAPFLGGTLCVQNMLRRTPVQTSTGGSASCTGTFSIDFNDHIAAGSDPALVAGVVVDGQWWSRDPAAPSTTNLTNGVEFGIAP